MESVILGENKMSKKKKEMVSNLKTICSLKKPKVECKTRLVYTKCNDIPHIVFKVQNALQIGRLKRNDKGEIIPHGRGDVRYDPKNKSDWCDWAYIMIYEEYSKEKKYKVEGDCELPLLVKQVDKK